MSDKYLIIGATGSIGSSLAQQLKESNQDAHLISRNEGELKSISEKLGFSFTVADVLEDGFVDRDWPSTFGNWVKWAHWF